MAGSAMEVASASATLAKRMIPDQWPTVAAIQKGDLASDELGSLTQALEAFISRLFCQLESLRDRLRDADSVDPVIDADTGITFLQWAQFQTRWGGFGPLDEAMKRGEADGVSMEFVERVFGSTE